MRKRLDIAADMVHREPFLNASRYAVLALFPEFCS